MNNELSVISEIAESAAFLEKRNIAVPLPMFSEPIQADWIRLYPSCFADILHRLATLTPAAEHIAAQKLESLMFDSEKIETEIQNLERRLADFPDNEANSRIRKRIDNLRVRFANGPVVEPTESRLQQLHKKLVERTRTLFFEQLRRSSCDMVEQTLCRELDIPSFPESWKEPLRRKIVFGVLDNISYDDRYSRKSVKRLGIKLLRSIAGEEYWDYRNEKENIKFVNRLKSRNIEVTPWLEAEPPERHVPTYGPSVMIAFETDPMEVMKMGAVFDTCLSPWDFNFFSTIANVVDMNKRVLYARDMKGTIQGRCLVTLTDNGEILAFRAYAHDESLDFQSVVTHYLERLATRMNTVVINEGEVSNLVSPEWYDDGSIGISKLFSFLNEGSPFRNTLPTLEPHRLVSVLEKELFPHPVGPFILTPFLDLPEVKQRPELVLPLIPYVSSAIDTEHFVSLIEILVQAKEKREAVRLTQQYVFPRLERLCVADYPHWTYYVSRLVDILPATFLPMIRRLGSRGPKKLTETQAEDRRDILDVIYKKLKRTRKATLVSLRDT